MAIDIKFTPELFQKIVDGKKFETRRPVKPQPPAHFHYCYSVEKYHTPNEMIFTFSPDEDPNHPEAISMMPKVFPNQYVMLKENTPEPKGIEVRIKAVRVERLQNIKPIDLYAEGFAESNNMLPQPGSKWEQKDDFRLVWSQCYGLDYCWDSNPWVWVIRW